MILTIDIGNTNILLGCFKGNELVFRERISSKREATDLEYAAMIKTALDMYTLTPQQIDGAIMASVVPTITNTLKRAIEKLIGIETLVVGPGIKSGLSIRIDNPAQLGSDGGCRCPAGVSTAADHHRYGNSHDIFRHRPTRLLCGRYDHSRHGHLRGGAGSIDLAALEG